MLAKITIVLLLTILGKALAFGRDAAIAWEFGASGSTDAYFIAVTVPGIFWVSVFTTISSVFLPYYVQAMARSRAEAERLTVDAIRIYMAVSAIIAIGVFIFARQIVLIAAPSASEHIVAQATIFTRIIAPVFCLTAYVGVQSALQQATGHFIAPIAVPVINNAITIAAVFIAAYVGDLRLAVAGGVLGWLVQVPIQRFQNRAVYATSWGFGVRRETLFRILILSFPITLAVLLDQINIFVGTLISSDFGAGAISHLNYAGRLTMFAAGLFSWVVSYFLFPALAHNAGVGKDTENKDILMSGTASIILFTVPMLVCCLLFCRDIVSLVYGRGAFSQADIDDTSRVFSLYALGIVFIAMRDFLDRIFFSYQRTLVPLAIGVGATAANLLASWVLSRWFGVSGVALGASCAAILFVLVQMLEIFRWKRSLLSWRMAVLPAISTVSGAVTYFAMQAIYPFFGDFQLIVRLIMGGVATCACYGVSALALSRIFKFDLRELGHQLQVAASSRRNRTPAGDLAD